MDSIQLSKITNLIIGADSKSENRFSNEEIIDYLISSGIERDTVMSLKPRDYKMPSLWLPKLLRNIYESGILIPVLLVMSEKVGFYNKNFTEDIRDAVGHEVWDTAIHNHTVDKAQTKELCIGRSAMYLAGDCLYYHAPMDKLFFIEVVQSVFGAGLVDFTLVNKMSCGNRDFFTMILNKCYRTDKEKMMQVAMLLEIPEDALYSQYS